LKAKNTLETLSMALQNVEKDVERVAGVFADKISEGEVSAAESSIPAIKASLTKVLQGLAKKVDGGGEALREQLSGMLERGRELRKKIEDLKTQALESKGGIVALEIVQDAKWKVLKAEDWIDRIDRIEEPWVGVEVLPDSIATPALEAADGVPAEAEPTVKAAKTAVLERMVETKRLPDGPARLAAAEELIALRSRVEKVALRITQLKVDTAARRTAMLLPEEIKKVAVAEAEVKKVVSVAEPLSEDVLDKKATEKRIKEACKKTLEVEKKINPVLAEARAALSKRQQDARARTSPAMISQLAKLSARLEKVETLSKQLRDGAANYEDSRNVLAKQKSQLGELDKMLSEVEIQTIPLGDERPTDEEEERLALAVQGAQDKMSAWRTQANKLVTPGALRIAIQRLVSQSDALQKRSDVMKRETRDRCGRAMCRIYLREGKAKVDDLEAAMIKAEQAEGPFLMGLESVPAKEAAAAIEQCEAAASVVKDVLDAARGWFRAKRAEVSGFLDAEDEAGANVRKLKDLAERVEVVGGKLAQFSSSTGIRKRAASLASSAPPLKAARQGP